MVNYVPIFGEIVTSSIWKEPHHVRVVWVTLLAIKDKDNIVRTQLHKIAEAANLDGDDDDELFLDAMKILSEPDKRRSKLQPYEGRRIEQVDEGWKILNGKMYQDLMTKVNQRAQWAKAQAKWRLKQGVKAAKNEMQAKADAKKRLDTFKEGNSEV